MSESLEVSKLEQLSNPTGKSTLAGVVFEHARVMPDRLAYICGTDTLCWKNYSEYSDKLAAACVLSGLATGDRIAIAVSDSCEAHVAFLACEKAGVTGLAIPSRSGSAEVESLMRRVGVCGMITSGQFQGQDGASLFNHYRSSNHELLHHIDFLATDSHGFQCALDGEISSPADLDVDAEYLKGRHAGDEDIFLLNTTSGTTGLPKCVMQTQRRWFKFAEFVQDTARLSADDVFLRAMPASVGFGLWTGHFVPALLGSTTVVLKKYSVPELLAEIERNRVSVLAAVSTQLVMMVNDPDIRRRDLSSLRFTYTGGEAVPYEKARQFEEVTGATILQFYGSNEAGGLSYTTVRDPQEKRLRTAGRVIPQMHVRLLDDQGNDCTDAGRGQPVCRGDATSPGYFDDPAGNSRLFTPEGDMRMEDFVSIDEDGYLSVIGRVGDFIIRGGKNISAAAVEEGILAHPLISMAAAIAVPDPVFGERVGAYVVLKEPAGLDLEDLKTFLSESGTSKPNWPERLFIVDEIPMAPGGKIAKKLLREDLRKRLANETDLA